MTDPRPILWTPSKARAEQSRMAAFQRWLAEERGLEFDDYNALWDWSVTDLAGFWSAIRDFAGLPFQGGDGRVLAERRMPGAVWFPGVTTNFARHMLRHAESRPESPALILRSEGFGRKEVTWAQLAQQVANVAAHLRAMGVGQGDRVVAILPNTDSAVVAFLAAASIGAIWSLCAPDMGHVAILDRFRQIEPKVLIAQHGYVHAGRMIDRRPVLEEIRAHLPSLTHTVLVPVMEDVAPGMTPWDEMTQGSATAEFADLPFDHPLWIVYSSGTTGNPKPIVHGHGGILLEGAKQALHQDLGGDDRFLWLTSSGWIMWNAQFVATGQGATVVLFDGAANHPDMLAVWRVVAEERVTSFGVGAAYVTQCLKSGIRPGDVLDLSALKSLGTTGSPLTAEGYDWVYDAVDPDIWLAPISGGTDLCGAFVGGNVMLPVRAGEMQCRYLGNAVRSFDPEGAEIIGEVGELVCTEPLPSMPLGFWGDSDGSRLHESYFDTYPGIWRHGDWIEITPEGGSVIYGRSDATINRKGLRLGSSEIYRAVEALPEVLDSLVVDLEFLGRDSFMPLFVVPAPGQVLDEALRDRINTAIRETLSPRFIPNDIVQIAEVPRTLSGKKLEVPVKKLLLGGDPAQVVNRDSMANPESFDFFVTYAAGRR
ncbi:acetoacetate--CoA ligase [Ruegeria pomeroyi]|uniref:Acetoacetate--CoA ligase n=1 Tax=Ruegeria alba TaxID=2916756 RepID=A0ABS9NS10_9RHOB|nr:acetoacetate--CoA ligase [Ruegeria alba]MCE8511544.1 acetoacetate--CoA ligase [Ruegeria pomeroyi]MCE8519975.1 acetoacetate--CoA ligase [Ruegeria pomeroyi]MCE8527785.1 acetoacetate--CoA ligase [Ruegeria pomeroyi]MCG6557013.1 acetoacetate--CoA ligase [Ruegeria alba]